MTATPTQNIVKVAVVQAEPAWLDLPAAVAKTCALIEEAAKAGAKLIAFPELWIPGYPAWIWTRPVDFDLATRYSKNSLKIDSAEMEKICDCAANNNIAVSLGFSENDGHHSLYIAQVTISPSGGIVMRRRKLKPTHMERTIFGDASGSSLWNVSSIEGVGKVGSLSCWEHIQPLLKYHTFSQGEEIHVAGWPPLYPHSGNGPDLWSMSKEGCHNLARTYAIESQTFVLHSTTVLRDNGINLMVTKGAPLMSVPGGGNCAIFGPDGRQISKDLPDTEEGIIYADLHLDEIVRIRGFADPCGHYSRPDMLWLGVDSRPKTIVQDVAIQANKHV